jgi:death-on-curing protein
VARRREPVWLSRLVVDGIHDDQLREHGGLPGLRDENVLESALARARQKWHHDPNTDLAMCAAAYAYGLVRNHPYRDGNKRIGFLTMVTFLGLNRYEFEATEADVVAEILGLAEGSVSEEMLADWIRQHSSRRR